MREAKKEKHQQRNLRYILQDYLYCLLANIFIPKFQRRKIIPVNINFFSDNLFFLLDRISERRCSVEKDVLRNFAKFTGKHLFQSLFFNKVASLRPEPCNFLQKETVAQVFPVNFVKFLRSSFIKEHLWWQFLECFDNLPLAMTE